MFANSVFLRSDINRFRARAHERLEPQRFYHGWNETFCFRARAHERLEPQRFYHRWNETFCFKWKRGTDGCFTAAFFHTQHASFSVRCGGRTAVGDGNVTRKNIPAWAHERQNNCTVTSLRLPFQASAQIMDLDFKIFDSERLINEAEKRPALYS